MINSVIVAYSSPLISLAIIAQLELLPQLYQRILLPTAVWDEITKQNPVQSFTLLYKVVYYPKYLEQAL
ncbi:hypothetical protein [Nostoc sp. KVJ3]|uniref:hypothetical protein n=1 Tax=Nostoc sp. KVJ3 TaxID=457945 RepID=UPI0022378A7B|nr:hypothetical protein [Nostoc sp. KVJ3]